MYRQYNERAGISIEQGTDNVPDDGKFHVLIDGEIVESSRNLRMAEKTYRKLIEEKNLPPLEPPPKLSAEEQKKRDMGRYSAWTLLGRTSTYNQGKKSGRYHKSK